MSNTNYIQHLIDSHRYAFIYVFNTLYCLKRFGKVNTIVKKRFFLCEIMPLHTYIKRWIHSLFITYLSSNRRPKLIRDFSHSNNLSNTQNQSRALSNTNQRHIHSWFAPFSNWKATPLVSNLLNDIYLCVSVYCHMHPVTHVNINHLWMSINRSKVGLTHWANLPVKKPATFIPKYQTPHIITSLTVQ